MSLKSEARVSQIVVVLVPLAVSISQVAADERNEACLAFLGLTGLAGPTGGSVFVNGDTFVRALRGWPLGMRIVP